MNWSELGRRLMAEAWQRTAQTLIVRRGSHFRDAVAPVRKLLKGDK